MESVGTVSDAGGETPAVPSAAAASRLTSLRASRCTAADVAGVSHPLSWPAAGGLAWFPSYSNTMTSFELICILMNDVTKHDLVMTLT